MISSKIILVVIMALGISGQSSTDTSLLKSVTDSLLSAVGTLNSYNGPTSISQASTTPSKTTLPTETKMRYYNYYAQSAYCTDQLKNLNCDICQNFKSDVNANEVAVLQNNVYNTLAFITVSDSRQEIVVTFRGTVSDLRNYLLDATLFNTGTNNIKFHLGFYIATMSLYNDVIVSVGYQIQRHSSYKVVFSGHSLGGAMARLTQYLVIYTNQFAGKTYELYTYGEPRVGNKAFVDFFNNLSITTARCVNKDDVVPHVPPTSILGTTLLYDFYIQPQLEVWIRVGGIQLCNPNFYEDPNCSCSVDPSYTTTDHSTYFNVVGNCSQVVTTTAPPPSNPPSLPVKILNFAGGAAHFLTGLLS